MLLTTTIFAKKPAESAEKLKISALSTGFYRLGRRGNTERGMLSALVPTALDTPTMSHSSLRAAVGGEAIQVVSVEIASSRSFA